MNIKRLPGTPDIVLRKYKTAIFVNGCSWHGHEGCSESCPPRTRVEWQTEKSNRNKVQDARTREELRTTGWSMMVIWECQLKPKGRQTILGNAVRLLEKTCVESTHHAEFIPAYPLLKEEELPKVAEEEISYESVHHY